MNLEDFSYDLKETQIAKFPPKIRGESRLLVLNKTTGKIVHQKYPDFINYLNAGDVLVINDTKVIKSRVMTHNENNKPVELLLLEKHFTAIGSKGIKAIHKGRVRKSDVLYVDNSKFRFKVKEIEEGILNLEFAGNLDDLISTKGEVPIPPYLKRTATDIDTERYQTVFALNPGSVAAPTASLNFTPQLQAKLLEKGVQIVAITLHVGYGTFSPIRVEKLEEHKMHAESYLITAASAKKIMQAKSSGKKVVALGTTVTRALEHAAEHILRGEEITAEADIFIYPGYKFKIIDNLITNFHAPKTTVLMLTAAFAGWDKLINAYNQAQIADYSFLSYGDSMLIN